MKTFPLLLVVIELCLMNPTSAQEASPDEAVRAELDAIRAAVMACDIDAYTEHWDEEASIFIVRGDSLKPIAEYLNLWSQVCASGGSIAFEPTNDQISVYSDVAVVTGLDEWTFTKADGTSNSGRQRSTVVLHKTSKGWKIVHAHGSALGPLDE